VLRRGGLLDSLATEETGITRRVVAGVAMAMAVGGTMVVKEARGRRLVIAFPARGMRALASDRHHEDKARLS
jgi:hypothetical protein